MSRDMDTGRFFEDRECSYDLENLSIGTTSTSEPPKENFFAPIQAVASNRTTLIDGATFLLLMNLYQAKRRIRMARHQQCLPLNRLINRLKAPKT